MSLLWRFGKPTTGELRALRRANEAVAMTYAEVGSSLGETPSGMHRLDRERPAGVGDPTFEQGRRAIRAWAGHRRAGVLLHPEVPPLDEGDTVAFAVPVVPLVWVVSACRIVRVVDDVDRFGFVYGTLPDHVESGEEAFLVERRSGGEIVFRVTAVSRPRSRLLRVVGPFGRLAQRWFAGRYLRGFASYRDEAAGRRFRSG